MVFCQQRISNLSLSIFARFLSAVKSFASILKVPTVVAQFSCSKGIKWGERQTDRAEQKKKKKKKLI